MKAIILGCGRVGAHLATALAEHGHHVTVLDREPKAFQMLGDDFLVEHSGGAPRQATGPGSPRATTIKQKITCVLGLGIDEDVLRQAGIENADAFAAVTDSDYTNIMACMMAKEIFRVPRVIARISEPKRKKIFHQLGLETFCPSILGAQSVFDLLVKAT
jgi:trk system potassium uptake protein TrkA